MRLIQFVFLLLFFSHCKDRFDIATRASSGSLVVDGNISDGPGPYILRLGTTSDATDKPDPLSGASIEIVDQSGQRETYREVAAGKYQIDGNVVKGTKGGQYYVDILTNDGRHYQSSQESMPLLQAQDSTSFIVTNIPRVGSEGIEIQNLVVQIFLNSLLPKSDGAVYFRWTVDEVYRLYPTCIPNPLNSCPEPCYITLPFTKSNLEVVDSRDFAGLRLDNILLQTKDVDYTFQSKHYFNVTQYGMNRGAFEYWQKVQALVSRNGSIFDKPPSNVTGNIYNVNDPAERVYGYFEASLQRVTRTGVARGFIPGDLYNPCLYNPNFGRSTSFYAPNCLNCLLREGSTKTQPDWFH